MSFHSKFLLFIKELRFSLFNFLKEPSGLSFFPIKQKLNAFLILTLIAVATYINTLGHQMAYDDEQVIRKNDFVLNGVSGIPHILTHDTHYSFYKNSNLENILPRGRYRPLSIISFAIEQQLVGTKHDSVPEQFIWDVNGNGLVDPDEDIIQDNVLNQEDFFARGLGLRHFSNILFFALTVGLIYMFFTKYFPKINTDVVFLACLIFAVHPIHTEVVANIKSRDEIFSLMFIIFTFLFAFRFLKNKKTVDLFIAAFTILLAVLSKEYALLMPLILPVLYFFECNHKFTEIFNLRVLSSLVFNFVFFILVYFLYNTYWVVFLLVPYIIVFNYFKKEKDISLLLYTFSLPIMLYLYLRLNATVDVGNEELFNANIISNPYLLANKTQVIATKIYVLLKYVFLLIIPFPLISDYSFNSIVYKDFASWEVIISILVYSTIILLILTSFFKNRIIGLFLFLFIIFLLPVSNIFINLGAVMGERLIYHSSLGFSFLLALPLNWIIKNHQNILRKNKTIILSFALLLLMVYFFTSYQRNKNWENNETLFAADLKKAPNNIVLLSGEARNLYLKAERSKGIKERNDLIQNSINLVDKGLNISGTYLPLYQTLALDFFLIKDYKSSVSASKAGLKLDSLDVTLKFVLAACAKEYIKMGINQFKLNKTNDAFESFDRAIKADKKNVDAYYNKAFVKLKLNDTTEAVKILRNGIMIEKKKELYNLLKKIEKN